MTTVTLTKTIDEKGVGYEIYDGSGKKQVSITIRVEEVNWNTKKTLIKTPYPGDSATETGTDVNFYYIDLKNVEEAVRIRGVLDDSVEESSTATSGTTTTLTDTSKSWTDDSYNGYYVKVHQNPGDTGTADASPGGSNTLSDIDKSWTTNQWVNHTVKITAGTGVGQVRTIVSNAPTLLTVSPNWSTVLDNDSQYIIYGGVSQTRKIIDTTSNTLIVSANFDPVPANGAIYEIIYPAWLKFWQLRGMCTTGLRLDSFIIGNLEFKGDHKMGEVGGEWKTSGATLEDVTMTIGPDDTGAIQTPLADVSRITITCSLVIGDDIQNVT